MTQEYKLKGVSSLDLPPGAKQEVEVEGVENGKVLLVNAAGKVQALGSKCTHYGAPLVKGVLSDTGGRITCPWHGACFNTKTGDVEDAPALDALPAFKVSERDGAVYISGEESDIKSSRRQPNFKCAASGEAEDGIVVVGGGSGAMGLIEGLREKGYKGPLTVISSEGYLPIDRTKLSKALITDHGKIALRDKAFFDSGSVKWIDGEVTGVDFSSRNVSTKSGETIPYNRLVLATGGTVKLLPLQGFRVLENIFTLRTLDDTKKIVEAIGEKGKNIVVIGSSFIGMEVAVATSKDNKVTVVGMEKAPLERVLGEKIGAGLQKALEGKGVKFLMNAGVEKAEPSTSDPAKVGAVVLKDGTRLEADLVILGVGVSPATQYLRDNKNITLEDDGSLKTDKNYRVQGVEDVFAIGDIAKFPYAGPGSNGSYTRIEHWNVAQNSGREVAKHIVNPSEEIEHFIPIFWSALGAQLRYCGNTVAGWDDVVIQGDPAENNFVAFYCNGDTVVAMASMGRDPAMSQSAMLMRAKKMPTKTQIQQGADILTIGVPP